MPFPADLEPVIAFVASTVLSVITPLLSNSPIRTVPGLSREHNAIWEQPLSFTQKLTGSNMKLQYLLYREDNMSGPYRDLYLWINAKEA
jgi:uncharacterized membrane protein